MSVAFPPKITSAQLKLLARLCGKTRSGTKAAIQERIVNDLKDFKPLAPGTRVLSIDLGIRNLAYSLLEFPASNEPSQSKGKKKRGKKEEAVPPTPVHPTPVQPILHAWERLALIPKTPKPPAKSKSTKIPKEGLEPNITDSQDSKTKRRSKKKAAESTESESKAAADAAVAAAVEEASFDPSTTPDLVEDFSPARLSFLTVELITERLLPLRPDIVIMEQQRFRSMGGSAVFEWTLRVNSLESMLYAVFATMRALGKWPGGRLEGVVARNVLEFMFVQEGAGEKADIWNKEKVGDNKKLKKDIVGRMLRSRSGVRIAERAVAVEEIAKEYLERWERAGKGGKKSAMDLKKVDDLADSLLQGIAFIRWQENKRKLLVGGVDALKDQIAAG